MDQMALTAAAVDAQTGREWRSLHDTTNAPIIAYRTSPYWPEWQRGNDYYSEGELIWLEVDMKVRQLSSGRRSLDDFAKSFFGGADGRYEPIPYTFTDLVRSLNKVCPFAWVEFFRKRVDSLSPRTPSEGLQESGYRLVFKPVPSTYLRSVETRDRVSDLSYSIGARIRENGTVASVTWKGPADCADLAPGDVIAEVGNEPFSTPRLLRAVADTQTRGDVRLLLKTASRTSSVVIDYRGGARYPSLERAPGPDRLSMLYARH